MAGEQGRDERRYGEGVALRDCGRRADCRDGGCDRNMGRKVIIKVLKWSGITLWISAGILIFHFESSPTFITIFLILGGVMIFASDWKSHE